MIERLSKRGLNKHKYTNKNFIHLLFLDRFLDATYYEVNRLRPRTIFSIIYLKTFVARYGPGHIFHFAGRQILGTKLGVSQTN